MKFIQLPHFLALTHLTFFFGMLGLILNRRNILITIMAIEMLLLSVNLNFVMFSLYLDDITGQIFVLFILSIAATESALGLSILTAQYRLKSSIQFEPIKSNSDLLAQ